MHTCVLQGFCRDRAFGRHETTCSMAVANGLVRMGLGLEFVTKLRGSVLRFVTSGVDRSGSSAASQITGNAVPQLRITS